MSNGFRVDLEVNSEGRCKVNLYACPPVSPCITFIVKRFLLKKFSGEFMVSRRGVELWTAQLAMTLIMNYCNYVDSLASPCNNALSCAVYIQVVLNGITVVFQVLLILYNRKHIIKCFKYFLAVTEMAEVELGERITIAVVKYPIVYNFIFTTFTIGRCVFMFVIKPKTPVIQMVQC